MYLSKYSIMKTLHLAHTNYSIGVTVGLSEMGSSHLENSPWATPKTLKTTPKATPHSGE